jgi:hypothetical protein
VSERDRSEHTSSLTPHRLLCTDELPAACEYDSHKATPTGNRQKERVVAPYSCTLSCTTQDTCNTANQSFVRRTLKLESAIFAQVNQFFTGVSTCTQWCTGSGCQSCLVLKLLSIVRHSQGHVESCGEVLISTDQHHGNQFGCFRSRRTTKPLSGGNCAGFVQMKV